MKISINDNRNCEKCISDLEVLEGFLYDNFPYLKISAGDGHQIATSDGESAYNNIVLNEATGVIDSLKDRKSVHPIVMKLIIK